MQAPRNHAHALRQSQNCFVIFLSQNGRLSYLAGYAQAITDVAAVLTFLCISWPAAKRPNFAHLRQLAGSLFPLLRWYGQL
jgi:hypothetical protein